MTGVDLDSDPSSPHNGMGIIPRSISDIFSRAAALKDERGGAWTYSIKGSFIELYNEDLIDLLSYEDGAGGRREEWRRGGEWDWQWGLRWGRWTACRRGGRLAISGRGRVGHSEHTARCTLHCAAPRGVLGCDQR